MGNNIVKAKITKDGMHGLVLADVHAPTTDKRAIGAVYKYVSERKWDFNVDLGDWADFGSISRHNKRALGLLEGQRVQKDFDAMEKSIAERKQAIGQRTPIYYIEGNHEYRLSMYLEEHPELKGLDEFNYAKRLNFQKNNITWIPFWSEGTVLKIGKALFMHGRYTGPGHTAKLMRNYECNLFSGHDHGLEMSGKSIAGENEYRIAMCIGTLQGRQKWMQGRPNKWVHAFAEFYFEKNGTFTFYVPTIINGQFRSQDGKLYKG
jgi:predicted phosphodiesterase